MNESFDPGMSPVVLLRSKRDALVRLLGDCTGEVPEGQNTVTLHNNYALRVAAYEHYAELIRQQELANAAPSESATPRLGATALNDTRFVVDIDKFYNEETRNYYLP